jgi:cytochrome d ubiquinol oxidase subunit II
MSSRCRRRPYSRLNEGLIAMNEYEIFRLLWWALLGVLLIGLAVMDGFDLGTGILLPFIGKNDAERRVVINTVGPVWEGNQVWLILGAGAIFAAWPMLYAVAFSGFYAAMLLLLFALFLRPVGFTYRSKLQSPRWRGFWDWALFAGGLVPALVYGVAFGNVLQGVPFSFDYVLRMTYSGSLLGLFNPFALLCGAVSVAMLTMHGAAFIACKTEAEIRHRAQRAGMLAGGITVGLFAIGGLWASRLNFYVLGNFAGTNGPSNMLLKQVSRLPGALLHNYHAIPSLALVPALGFVGALAAIALFRIARFPHLAFIASGLSVAGIIGTAGVSLFPFMLPSSSDPSASLIIWDTSSSLLTLQIMTGAAVIFLPLIIIYTSWVYYMLRGPVTLATIKRDDHTAY